MTAAAADDSSPDLVAAIMEQVKSLSPEYQQFFLDYVEFLLQKYSPAQTPAEETEQPGA